MRCTDDGYAPRAMTAPRSASPSTRLLAPLVLLLSTSALCAQVDLAEVGKRREAAKQAATSCQQSARAAVQAAQKKLAGQQNKVLRGLDDILLKLEGLEFEAGLGGLDFALSYLEEIAEADRAATKTLLDAIQKELQAGDLANRRETVLAEVAERLQRLATSLAEKEDVTAQLVDLDDTTARAARSTALPPQELHALRKHIAAARAQATARTADEMRAKATTDLAALEASWPALEAEFGDANAGTRDSGFAKFDEARNAIRDSLTLIPEADAPAAQLRERLAKLEVRADAHFAKAYLTAILERTKPIWEGHASEIEGWDSEAGTASFADYVNIDGTGISQLNLPRCVALVKRSNEWLVYATLDPEYGRAKAHPELAKLMQVVSGVREKALAKLVPVAEALVAEAEKTGLADERTRDRIALLADWDLRLALQEVPKQWELIPRLHALVDAFDQKALGAEKAAAKTLADAKAAAEVNWTRMMQIVPVLGGFEPTQAWKFRGQLVRLEGARDRTAEFRKGRHDLVFTARGVTFAAIFDAPLAAHLALVAKRTGWKPGPDAELDLLFHVADEGKLVLAGPDAGGKPDDVEIPCRTLRVIGLRSGPVAFVTR